jgi:putative transposase
MVGYRKRKTGSGNAKGIQSNTPTEKHHRRSIRLKDYDYSQAGGYFVTLGVRRRESLLGHVLDGKMRMNEMGRIVEDCCKWLCGQYEYVSLDEWIVMPNHLHGIVLIVDKCGGGSRTAPTNVVRKPLGRLIGAFKTTSTKRINEMRDTSGISFWQRNYYEHIVRNEDELNQIREYILYNPLQWQFDRENPERIQSKVYDNQWSHFDEGIYGKKK